MLVLTRPIGSKFTIGDDITVEFLSFSRGNARIGITAPKDVVILRDDVKDKTPRHCGPRPTTGGIASPSRN